MFAEGSFSWGEQIEEALIKKINQGIKKRLVRIKIFFCPYGVFEEIPFWVVAVSPPLPLCVGRDTRNSLN